MTNASAGMSKSALLATGDPTGLAAEIAVQKTRALVNRAVWLQAALVLTLRRSEQVRRMIPRRVRGASADPDSAVEEALRSAVRLRLKNGSLPRAKLGNDCPALGFYSGFYVKANKDKKMCAKRDSIRSRSGRQCAVQSFASLVPAR